MKLPATAMLITVAIAGCATQGRMVNGKSSPASIEHYVEEVREHFTIREQPIHPFVFRDLGGWDSDSRPIITAVDVLAGVDSNYYFSGGVEKTPHGFRAWEQDG